MSVCYEYVNSIFQHAPEETTPEGLTRQNAIIGQLLFGVAHEMGHAVFEMFTIPVFGREEDAADQVATFFLLHLGMERARWLIEGAAHAYRGYVKDYKQNPDVRVKLEAFSSNHGSPEERFYNLLCIAYGANPTLFGYVVENGYLQRHAPEAVRMSTRH